MKTFKEFVSNLYEEINMNPFFDRVEAKNLQFSNLKRELLKAKIIFKEISSFFLEFSTNDLRDISRKLDIDIGFKTIKKNPKIIEKQKKDTHIILSIAKGKVRLELV